MSYKPFEYFVFRTPLFPFNYLLKEEELINNKVFAETLLIASPDLSESMDKDEDRVQFSTYRYYQRACTRPTPFGLFAGCSIGTVGEHTDIKLSEQKEYKRVTRLDMNYICALIQQIERDRNIRRQLNYYPNSSIYTVGCHLRYIEYHYRKMRRIHQIKQVENSEYLRRILDITRTGALFAELEAVLIDDDITEQEAAEFIHELIDAQILVSELEPAVTNVKPLTALIEKLNELSIADEQITGILSEIEMQLSNIDSQSIGNTNTIYPIIIKNIEKIKVAAEIKYLFQTDLFKPVQHATVSRHLIQDIQQVLIFLSRITPLSTGKNNLSQFKENFVKRYEEREMPLLFVLDNELGIGYAGNTSGDISPLVDDLEILRGYSSSNVFRSPIQSVLMQKHQQFSQKVIELTDEDVNGIEPFWDDLPPTFSVMCQILQDDDQQRSIYIKMVGGCSATNLLGRFCHLDEQIFNHTLTITEKEVQINPGVIFAEIVHLPESRTGNILLRPILRPYEIPYLSKSGVPKEFELVPYDLYISVKNNRIVLRSKRLNKEIVPRMSTAHNYSGITSMPVYHFLCDLQHQNGRAGLWFRWDEAVQQLDYLPRIIYKNCILSKANWKVRGKDVEPFAGIKENDELRQKVKEWQEYRNIPNKVLLVDGDNELYIDMNNLSSIRAWLSVVKKRPSFQLEEFIFDPETAVVHGPNGVFTNEFIFSFYRESMTKKE